MNKHRILLAGIPLAIAGICLVVGFLCTTAPDEPPRRSPAAARIAKSASRPAASPEAGREVAPAPHPALVRAGIATPMATEPRDRPQVTDLPPEPSAGRSAPSDSHSVAGLMLMQPGALREVARLSSDPIEVQAAAWVMASRLNLSNEDVQVLLDRLARAREEQTELTRTLIWALSLRPDAVSTAQLAEYALDHRGSQVRRTALRSLAALADPRAQEVLMAAASRDPEARNRSESVTLLALRLDAQNALETAQQALARETDGAVRARWLNLVGVHRSREAQDLLRHALYSAGETLQARTVAAEMLAAESATAAQALAADPGLPAEVRDRVTTVYLTASRTSAADLPRSR